MGIVVSRTGPRRSKTPVYSEPIKRGSNPSHATLAPQPSISIEPSQCAADLTHSRHKPNSISQSPQSLQSPQSIQSPQSLQSPHSSQSPHSVSFAAEPTIESPHEAMTGREAKMIAVHVQPKDVSVIVTDAPSPKTRSVTAAPIYPTLQPHNSMAGGGSIASNGSLTNGSLTNGSLTNGSLTNGSLTNGSLTNGSLTNGSVTNGSLTNGSVTNGADAFAPPQSLRVRWERMLREADQMSESEAESDLQSQPSYQPQIPLQIAADALASSIPLHQQLRSTVTACDALRLLAASIGAQIFARVESLDGVSLEYIESLQATMHTVFAVPVIRSKYLVLPLSNMRLGRRVIEIILDVLLEREIADGPGAICFSNNFLTSESIPKVIQYMGYASHLIALDLSYNPIGNEGVSEIAKHLSRNASLQRLDLSFVSASDGCTKDLCAMIQENKCLQAVRLEGNQFQRVSISSIISALKANFTLATFDIRGCTAYEQRFHRKIEEILSRNNELKLSLKTQVWHCHQDFCPTPWHPSLWQELETVTSRLINTIEVITPVNKKTPGMLTKMATIAQLTSDNRSLKELAPSPESVTTINRLEGNKTWKLQGRFHIGCSDTIGKRPSMEDVMVFCENFRNKEGDYILALFDGHGGCDAANFVSENILGVMTAYFDKKHPVLNPVDAIQHSLSEIQSRMKGYLFTGTTLAMAVVLGDTIYAVNVGDSRIVLSRGGEPVRLTRDHKPYSSDEKKRIMETGGFVEEGRLNGALGLSRALGDSFHWPQVSGEPYISRTSIMPCTSSDRNLYDPRDSIFDEFLIIACDGLWDVLTDLEAVNVVRYCNYWENPDLAAQNLRNVAYGSGSTDNISVMVVSISPQPKRRKK